MRESYWRNKSVLVTGASSGLGWAIVEALAPAGVHFCLLSRREERMCELAGKLKDSGSSFWIRACDVRNREAVAAAVADFTRERGGLDVAWVNSGVGADSSFEGWDWDKIECALDTNLKGVIYTIRACLEVMVPRRAGTVAAVGSATAMRGQPTRGIYGLTKAGLEYFMESLSAELPKIQFTTIHPGFVETEINRGARNKLWPMSAEKAAGLMIRAVERGKRFYVFPARMRLLYRVVRAMPAPLYFSIVRKRIQRFRE